MVPLPIRATTLPTSLVTLLGTPVTSLFLHFWAVTWPSVLRDVKEHAVLLCILWAVALKPTMYSMIVTYASAFIVSVYRSLLCVLYFSSAQNIVHYVNKLLLENSCQNTGLWICCTLVEFTLTARLKHTSTGARARTYTHARTHARTLTHSLTHSLTHARTHAEANTFEQLMHRTITF